MVAAAIFVPCRRIRSLSDKLPHSAPVLRENVVHLGKNESGHNDQTRGRQDLLVLGRLGLPSLVLDQRGRGGVRRYLRRSADSSLEISEELRFIATFVVCRLEQACRGRPVEKRDATTRS